MIELNEMAVAAGSLEFANKLRQGQGTAEDRLTLGNMGFNPREIDLFMEGQAPRELNERLGRKAVVYTMGGTMATPAENSYWGNSRVFRTFMAFQQYFQTRTNQLMDIRNAYVEAKAAGNQELQTAAVKQFARFMGASATAGAASLALLHLWKDGLEGLEQEIHEAGEEPIRALGRTVAANLIGGLGGNIFEVITGTGYEQDFLWDLTAGVAPLQTGRLITEFATGTGKFKGEGFLDDPLLATSRFLTEAGPLGRDLRRGVLGVSAFALERNDKTLRLARNSYWEWLRNHGKLPEFGEAKPRADLEAFYKAMRRFKQLIKLGRLEDDQQLRQALLDALKERGVKDLSGVGTSIRNLRMFKGSIWGRLTDAEKEKLRDYIGVDGVTRLEAYDDLLTHFASMSFLRREKARAGGK